MPVRIITGISTKYSPASLEMILIEMMRVKSTFELFKMTGFVQMIPAKLQQINLGQIAVIANKLAMLAIANPSVLKP